ncbi:unnamed protein product [Phytophthora fragariaefolia]|uniref:Unnamed protein product n=1 Tax=Phytophthora fragariaefolia TaxID=1490495 RepID=A0A9W6YN57_9STRA|nr:unnamed protein product [Phytophthora fragariaefolia]
MEQQHKQDICTNSRQQELLEAIASLKTKLTNQVFGELVLINAWLGEAARSARGDGIYKCVTCNKQYKKGNGYTNLLGHLCRNHENYEEEAVEASRRQNPLRLHLFSARTRDLYRWIEWIVCDFLPFAFVERPLTRQNAALSLVSEDTLSKYIAIIFELLQHRVAREMLSAFGLVIDGWTSSNRHYVAIFAVFDSAGTGIIGGGSDTEYFDDLAFLSRRFLLLAFSPQGVEEDLGAQKSVQSYRRHVIAVE